MEMVTCKKCGKLFNYLSGQRLCPACNKELEEKFIQVKKYVREHPDIDMRTLTKDCEVSPKQVQRWVREDRLAFSSDSPIGIPCEGCGTTIKSGRFCKNCKDNVTNALSEAAGLNKKPQQERPKKKQPTSDKMRFLG